MNARASQKPQAPGQAYDVFLTIMTGPDTGVAYKLVGQSITIGRSPDNNVVLQDNKASRNHARLEQRPDGYWIQDLGSQNGIILNGQSHREVKLKSGDQLIIGTTVVQFGAPPVPLLQSTKTAAPGVQPLMSAPMPPPHGTGMNPNEPWPMAPLAKSKRSRGPSPEQKLVMGVAVAILVGSIAMLTSSEIKKRKAFELQDENKMQETLETIGKENLQKFEEIKIKGKDTPEYIEAQNFYLRGFREFREGNFIRAMQNFNSSLALFPAHPLARRYLERSQIRLREEAIAALARGEKALQLQKYGQALNEYQTVKRLLGDPNNENYKLAEQRIRTIELERKRNR